MWSILVVFNKHNTARVASCWFIIYYRLVMHRNSYIKFKLTYFTPFFLSFFLILNSFYLLIVGVRGYFCTLLHSATHTHNTR